MRYVRITTDGLFIPDATDGPVNAKTLHEAVGGYIELVQLTTVPGCDLWCNEDGKRLGLAPNPWADALAEHAGLDYNDRIVGDVAVTGRADADPISLTISQMEALHAIWASVRHQ